MSPLLVGQPVQLKSLTLYLGAYETNTSHTLLTGVVVSYDTTSGLYLVRCDLGPSVWVSQEQLVTQDLSFLLEPVLN